MLKESEWKKRKKEQRRNAREKFTLSGDAIEKETGGSNV